jgi:hypothetical protein
MGGVWEGYKPFPRTLRFAQALIEHTIITL